MARNYDEFLADLAKKQEADKAAAAAQGQPQVTAPTVAPVAPAPALAPAPAPKAKGGIPAFLLPPEPKPAAAQKKSAAPSAPKVTTKVETRKAKLPAMSQVSSEVKSGAPNAQPGAVPQPPVQREITLPPDVAKPVDWKKYYDTVGSSFFKTAKRSAAAAMGLREDELDKLAQAQGVDLESINSAKLKGRTYDEIARAARERGVLGFLPEDERLTVFRRSVEDIEKAARGEASDRQIELVKSGADQGLSGGGAAAGGMVGLAGGPVGAAVGAAAGSVLGSGGYLAAGTSTELPEVSKPGEYGYLGATLLVEALQKDPTASRIYDLYGRGLATGNTQKYVEDRVADLLKRTGFAPGSAQAEEVLPKLRRRAINEVLAYKTIGQWTPAITMQDVQVTEGAAAPGFFAALGPNVELVGINNKNQAVYRQESPLGVLFRAIDIPQEALVAKLEGRDAAEGIQAGSNLFEYAIEHTKDESPYVRYPAMAAGFLASVVTPDLLLAGGVVQKGAKAAKRAMDIRKNGAKAIQLLETVAEARQAKDYVRATTAERELRELSPGIADQLDRYDANAAGLIEMVDPNTDILNEDMAALIGSQIPSQKEFAAQRLFLHPSVRKPELSGNLPKKSVPVVTYSGLFDTDDLLKRAAEAKKSYIDNAPATIDDYAKMYARGTARDVLSDAVDKGALTPVQADEIADIVAKHAPVSLTDEQRFADLVRQEMKAHPEYGQSKYNIIRQVIYTPGKNKLRGRLDRKLTDIKGKTVAQIQAPDIALFDRAIAAIEKNNEARGTGAALLRDEIAKEAKLRVQPLNLFDDVALKTPEGEPIRLSPGGVLWLKQVRTALPNQDFKEAYGIATTIDALITGQAKKRGVDAFDLYRELLPSIRQATDDEILRITGRAPGAPTAPAAPTMPVAARATAAAAAAPTPAALGAVPLMTAPAVMTAPTATTRGAAATAAARFAAVPKMSPHGAIAAQFVAQLPARMVEENITDVARAKAILTDISRGTGDYFEVEGLRTTISSAARDGSASTAVAAGDVRIVVDQPKAGAPFVIHALVGDKVSRIAAPRGIDAEAAMRRGIDEAEKMMEARVKAGGPAIKGAPVLPAAPVAVAPTPRAVRPARIPRRPAPRVFEPIPDELDLDITAELPTGLSDEELARAIEARVAAGAPEEAAAEITQALPPQRPTPAQRSAGFERLFQGGETPEPTARLVEEAEPTTEVTASLLEPTREIPRRRIRAELVRGEQDLIRRAQEARDRAAALETTVFEPTVSDVTAEIPMRRTRAELVRGEQAIQRRLAAGEEAFQRNLSEARDRLAELERTERMPEREVTEEVLEPTAKVEAPRAAAAEEAAAEPVFQRLEKPEEGWYEYFRNTLRPEEPSDALRAVARRVEALYEDPDFARSVETGQATSRIVGRTPEEILSAPDAERAALLEALDVDGGVSEAELLDYTPIHQMLDLTPTEALELGGFPRGTKPEQLTPEVLENLAERIVEISGDVADFREVTGEMRAMGAAAEENLADVRYTARQLQDRIVPVEKDVALDFVRKHHSKLPEPRPQGLLTAVGVSAGGDLRVVGLINTPSARYGDAAGLVEVSRVASDGKLKGGASAITLWAMENLQQLNRSGDPSKARLVTTALLSEPGEVYKALEPEGLRATGLVVPSAGTGSRAGAAGTARKDEWKINWEFGPAALPEQRHLADLPPVYRDVVTNQQPLTIRRLNSLVQREGVDTVRAYRDAARVLGVPSGDPVMRAAAAASRVKPEARLKKADDLRYMLLERFNSKAVADADRATRVLPEKTLTALGELATSMKDTDNIEWLRAAMKSAGVKKSDLAPATPSLSRVLRAVDAGQIPEGVIRAASKDQITDLMKRVHRAGEDSGKAVDEWLQTAAAAPAAEAAPAAAKAEEVVSAAPATLPTEIMAARREFETARDALRALGERPKVSSEKQAFGVAGREAARRRDPAAVAQWEAQTKDARAWPAKRKRAEDQLTAAATLLRERDPVWASAHSGLRYDNNLENLETQLVLAPSAERAAIQAELDATKSAVARYETEMGRAAPATPSGITPAAVAPVVAEKISPRAATFATAEEAKTAAEANRAATETPEFKAWFGGSKVVDSEGKPLVVYHGTDASFDSFAIPENGVAYFSPDTRYGYLRRDGGAVIPAYVSLKRPYFADRVGFIERLRSFPEDVAELKSAGYDGVIYADPNNIMRGPTGWGNDYSQIAVFEPNQIKSATGNVGTFSEAESSILKQVGPAGQIKGVTELMADGRSVILLFEQADASTVLHEVAHIVRRNVLDQDDMDAITKWIVSRGVKVGHQYGEFTGSSNDVEQAEELFAKAFEEYVRQGVAPNSRVQAAFDALKTVIANIYRGVSDSVIGANLQPEVRQVFDKLLADVPEQANPTIKQVLRQQILGTNAREQSGFLDVLAKEATRKGLPRSSLEEVTKQFDFGEGREFARRMIEKRIAEQGETPTQAAEAIRKAFGPSASTPAAKMTDRERGIMAAVSRPGATPDPIRISFPVPVLGKKDWTIDDLAELQASREVEAAVAAKRKQGLLIDLAGGSKTAAAVPEEDAVESLRSAIAYSDDDSKLTAKSKQIARGVAATFFGGDVVGENGMRQLPPELRNAINTTVAVVEQSIGDVVSLTNDALVTGQTKELYRYLAGGGDIRRLAGRPIVSAGHDYMGSVRQMFQRTIASLSPEEQVALTKLCDALNLPAGSQRNKALETLGFDDTGATFKLADAARQKTQDEAVSAVNKLLYLKGKEKETDFGASLATAMRNAVEAPPTPRPTHEMRLVEAMSYIAGNTSRGGSLFKGDSQEAAKVFLTDVGSIYKSEDSARRMAVLIGGYGSAALGKNILVKLNLGISPDAYKAFTRWLAGENWDPRYTEEIQRIVDRYGYNPEFVADQVLASDMYIPRIARERMGEALARSVYRPSAAVTGGDAVNIAYRYMKTRMTRGSFFLRQRYFMMNTVDHFIQMAVTAGFGTAAVSVTRVLAQDLMVLPFWQQIVEMARKVPVAGGLIPRDALERARRFLQSGGDTVAGHLGTLFGASKYRIEVNPILEGIDGGFRAGGKVYRYRDIRDIAVQERVFASYDTRQLANAIEREGNLFFSPTLTGAGGTLTTATGKSRIRDFLADWQSVVSETAEAWGERERLGAMVSFMEAGYDPRTAARLVTQALYDYSQSMTKADRSMLVGILFPFWAFQKNANAQVFNTVFSPWGAYRMMCIKRARERGMEALTEILYGDVGGEYEIDVESMPPELQDSYYALITRFEESYPNGEPPPEAKRAMRMLLAGRARMVEEGKLVELAANLQLKRDQGAFADLQRFSAYAVARPSKSQRPTYMRDRAGAAIPFPRTEAVRMYYSMVGDDHSYMELFIPESSIEAGFKHLTQVSAAYVLMGAVPVDFLLGGTLKEEGLDEVTLKRVVDPIADPTRSPLLAPLIAGSLEDAVPPRKVSMGMAAGAEALKQVHPFVGKLMDDAFGTTFLRVPQIADPFVLDPSKGETMGLPPEEAERIRQLQKQYPDASVIKDQRYYIFGGVWATAFDNSPFGELNAMLLRYEANPMERNDIRGEILRWARGSMGLDVELVSPKAVIQREEPEKLKSTRKM